MSIRSKLAHLERSIPDAPPAEGPPPDRARVLDELRARIQSTLARTGQHPPRPPLPDLAASDLPFAVEQTGAGPRHVRLQRLSPAHRIGRIALSPALTASVELLALLALDPGLAECDPSGALFLDTETTGLAGGAGTVAFLVGLAWWDGRALVLEQLLLRELGEEAPLLERVAERLQRASMLVTFNGKSFDMPLLRTRFVMARRPVPAEPPHLDLLHVARRIHRRRHGAHRLVGLERSVLGFVRHDDVESRDVSACYVHFLRTGDARALLGVVEHNAWDVLSMAALVGLYGEPLHEELRAGDLVGIARTLRRAGSLDRASDAAEAAVAREVGPESLRARAEIAKARGDRARALADFESIARDVDDASVRLELAKLYEHWARQPARALECVALGTTEPPERARHRAARLARKAERLRRQSAHAEPPGRSAAGGGERLVEDRDGLFDLIAPDDKRRRDP